MGEQLHVPRGGLGDQHAVEGIAVDPGESANEYGRIRIKRKFGQPLQHGVIPDFFRIARHEIGFERVLDRDFLNRDRTEEKLVCFHEMSSPCRTPFSTSDFTSDHSEAKSDVGRPLSAHLAPVHRDAGGEGADLEGGVLRLRVVVPVEPCAGGPPLAVHARAAGSFISPLYHDDFGSCRESFRSEIRSRTGRETKGTPRRGRGVPRAVWRDG